MHAVYFHVVSVSASATRIAVASEKIFLSNGVCILYRRHLLIQSYLAIAAAGVNDACTAMQTSLEHSVSYNDEESVPVIMCSLQLRMTCVMCWL